MHHMSRWRQVYERGIRCAIGLLAIACWHSLPEAQAATLQQLSYGYDNAGNVTGITDQLTPPNSQTFAYDALDRLTSTTGPYGAGGANASLTYTYNELGNLTNSTQPNVSGQPIGQYAYPGVSGPTSVTRPHAVCATGTTVTNCAAGTPYTYDANGNMTAGAGRVYAWNPENKPTCIATATGACTAAANKSTFVYDGDGGRVKKIVGATTTRYISKLYECDNTSCSRFIWAGDTRIATVAANGLLHYWHGDHLGSSSVITDSASAKVQAVTYYPYGHTRTNQSFTTPTIDVPYKYTGQELDSTGLYYYEARYYDATLGRFISADTLVPNPEDPQDLNRYSYVDNNPLRHTDPSGHQVSCGKNDGSHFCNSLAKQNGQQIVSSYFQQPVAGSKQSGGSPITSAQRGKRNLPPAQMSPAQVGQSGNKLSLRDVSVALDVIGKSSFVLESPNNYTDAYLISKKLNTLFVNGKIGFGVPVQENAIAESLYGIIVLNPNLINLGICPLCNLPGTLFHEGVHAFYGDLVTSKPIENRAWGYQFMLEMSLFNDPNARLKPLSLPIDHRIR